MTGRYGGVHLTLPAPPLTSSIPRDEIGFEVLSNALLFCAASKRKDANADFDLYQHAMDILEKVSGEGKISSRAIAAYENRVNIKRLPDHKLMLITQFKLSDVGSMARRQVTSAKCLEVRWRSTDKGYIYFVYPDNSQVWMLFYAHFFDRFVARGLKTEDERNIAIGKFLWRVLCRSNNKLHYEDDWSITLFCEEGAALGHLRVLTDKSASFRVHCVLFKTFISRDMFSSEQRRVEETLAKPLSPLTYETF